MLGLRWLYADDCTALLPDSESCSRRTNCEEGVGKVDPPEGDTLAVEQLRDGQIWGLSDFTRNAPDARDYIGIDTAVCPDCDAANFLFIRAVETTTDKDGNHKIASRPLVGNMIVHRDDTDRMQSILEGLSMSDHPPEA